VIAFDTNCGGVLYCNKFFFKLKTEAHAFEDWDLSIVYKHLTLIP